MMQLSDDGQYHPVPTGTCTGCGLCAAVCPQLPNNGDTAGKLPENSLTSASLLGDGTEIKTWAGYASNLQQRLRSASGGLLSLVLEHLIDTGAIDAAVVVGRSRSQRPLFEATLARTVDDVQRCASSKYYPVELSRILAELRISKERVAVVGLPCHVNAVRRLMDRSAGMRDLIIWLFGLVCGRGASTHFTEMLLSATGVSEERAETLSYRDKAGSRTARDFAFRAFGKNGPIGRRVAAGRFVYMGAWTRRIFVPRGCDFCTDCFAERADASFMDAWLPEYAPDTRGTSLVITRNSRAAGLLLDLAAKRVAVVGEISEEKVVQSQASVVRYKRQLIRPRISQALARGRPVPDALFRLAAEGTDAARRENERYCRNRQRSLRIWRTSLPPRVKIALMALFVGPGVWRYLRAIGGWFLGSRSKLHLRRIKRRLEAHLHKGGMDGNG